MDLLELFDRYFNNELSLAERKEFEQQLKSDPDFKEGYEEFLEMQKFLEVKPQIEEGKKVISELRKEQERKNNRKKVNRNRFAIVSAMLASAAAILLLIMFLQEPKTYEALYAENFEHPEISITTKSGEVITNSIELGLEYYNDLQYNLAFENLDTSGISLKDIPTILLAKGIAGTQSLYINEGNQILEDLAENYPLYSNDANWYLALSSLKIGNLDQSLIFLEKITNESNLSDRKDKLITQLEKLMESL